MMPEPELSAETKKLISDLRQSGLAFNRKEAVEKIGKLKTSNAALVTALIKAREFDDNEEVRQGAADALRSPTHQAILEMDPGLEKRAVVAPKTPKMYSSFGILSYAFAMIAIFVVYLDLFVIDPQLSASPNPLGLGIDSVLINSFFLMIGSFVLPLLGLISGILALRYYEKKSVLGIIGLVGNALILLVTSYSIISR
jgi:hypothetical protein